MSQQKIELTTADTAEVEGMRQALNAMRKPIELDTNEPEGVVFAPVGFGSAPDGSLWYKNTGVHSSSGWVQVTFDTLIYDGGLF